MATLNLGRIKPVFRGAYAGGTAYVVDDIVTSGNETFICILASTGNATSNATYWTKLAAKGTDGTDLTSTLTTEGDILYRDGSGLQRLAKGTGTQTLQMNSGATAPEWTTVAPATSDFVKLADISSSSGEVSIDGHFTSDYEIYKLFLWDINADGTQWTKFFVNKSATKQTAGEYRGAGKYVQKTSSASSHNVYHKWDEVYGIVHYWGTPGFAEMTIYEPLGSQPKHFHITSSSYQGDASIHAEDSTWVHSQTSAISGITLGSSGTLAVVKGTLYGLKS